MRIQQQLSNRTARKQVHSTVETTSSTCKYVGRLKNAVDFGITVTLVILLVSLLVGQDYETVLRRRGNGLDPTAT